MANENQNTDEIQTRERHPRRMFFRTAVKIGAGLVAFAPTLGILLKNTNPRIVKAIPN